MKKIVAKLISYIDSLKLVLGKATIYSRDNLGLATVSEIADKILETFSDLQDMQMSQEREKIKRSKKLLVRPKEI